MQAEQLFRDLARSYGAVWYYEAGSLEEPVLIIGKGTWSKDKCMSNGLVICGNDVWLEAYYQLRKWYEETTPGQG